MWVPLSDIDFVLSSKQMLHKDKPTYAVLGVDRFREEFVWVDSESGQWIFDSFEGANQMFAAVRTKALHLSVKELQSL